VFESSASRGHQGYRNLSPVSGGGSPDWFLGDSALLPPKSARTRSTILVGSFSPRLPPCAACWRLSKFLSFPLSHYGPKRIPPNVIDQANPQVDPVDLGSAIVPIFFFPPRAVICVCPQLNQFLRAPNLSRDSTFGVNSALRFICQAGSPCSLAVVASSFLPLGRAVFPFF